MKQKILSQIKDSKFSKFVFKANQVNPIEHLKTATANVPNNDGNYYVFANADKELPEHLIFNILNNDYELIYFGISGGVSKSGKVGLQKLKDRINNVVGSSSIKRAKYWDSEMKIYNINEFTVFYCINNNPKEIEDYIYEFLKSEKLNYPKLNKKRGRKKKS